MPQGMGGTDGGPLRDPAPPAPLPVPDGPALGLARAYRRRPAVEAEIRALPAATDLPALAAAAARAKAPETVVYAIRQLLRSGDTAAANRLFARLIAMAAPVFADTARRYFPRTADDRAELIQRASVHMWQEVFDVRPAQEFWEVFFSRVVRLICVEAAVAIKRPQAHERSFAVGVTPEGDLWREEETWPAPIAEVDGDRILVDHLVERLSGPVQQAVRLRLQGLPETSHDPTVLTISQLMGVSDRTVLTYLRAGEQQIREWLARPSRCTGSTA
jgi:hypothetical protein